MLKEAEESGFNVMVTSDQDIRYQQNLTGRKLALAAKVELLSALAAEDEEDEEPL